MIAALVVVALVGGWAYFAGARVAPRRALGGPRLAAGAETRRCSSGSTRSSAMPSAGPRRRRCSARAAALARRSGQACAPRRSAPARRDRALFRARGDRGLQPRSVATAGSSPRSIRELRPRRIAAFMKASRPCSRANGLRAPVARAGSRAPRRHRRRPRARSCGSRPRCARRTAAWSPALGFGRLAAQRFRGLLALARGGTSRDAYAFDEDARSS
jgi:hypothetical protein